VNPVLMAARHAPRLIFALVVKPANYSHIPPILWTQVSIKRFVQTNVRSDRFPSCPRFIS
jgi:oxalate decarboxylase/phosphoglucose isomerase-like protein (cupin superfamily)